MVISMLAQKREIVRTVEDGFLLDFSAQGIRVVFRAA